MTETELLFVRSSKSQYFVLDGHRFDIQIYRGKSDRNWLLEVIDCKGTSHFWDDRFQSDKDALDTALDKLERDGIYGFLCPDDDSNVIPFRRM